MKLLQINPVIRQNTSTGRIMREIGELAQSEGWQSVIAYSGGRDGFEVKSSSVTMPVGTRADVAVHGLATRLFDRHGLASRKATERFVERIKEYDPNIVHIHNIHGYFLHYPTLFRYLKESGKKVVWTVHDCWLYTGHCYHYMYAGCGKWESGCGNCPQKRSFPASFWIDRSARNWADKRDAFTSLAQNQMVIVPVSDWLRQEMSRSFLKNCDFRVIHNGIDLDVFKPKNASEMLAKYGLASHKKIILGVASIWSREKGFDDLIKLSHLLKEDEQMVMVGLDRKLIDRLPDGVIGIERTANVEELAALYSSASVFVNPTWQDNYPTVNLESIACGTPVITYSTGGSVEAISNETGLVVDKGDILGLRNAINKISERSKSEWTDSCRAVAEANFSKRERYADYLRLYEDLLRE